MELPRYYSRGLRAGDAGVSELRDGPGRLLGEVSGRLLGEQQSPWHDLLHSTGREFRPEPAGLRRHVGPLQSKLFCDLPLALRLCLYRLPFNYAFSPPLLLPSEPNFDFFSLIKKYSGRRIPWKTISPFIPGNCFLFV